MNENHRLIRLRHKSLAEFIGTFAIVFIGCGSIMLTERIPGSLSPSSIPIIFGIIVASMIYAVGHISGAHFNPAVTLAFSISRHFPKKEIPFYWAAQFLGAIFAMTLLYLFLPTGVQFGATQPRLEILPALGLEIILSFFLMFVIIAVATDSRAQGVMAGVAIGGIVAVCSYFGGPLTGCSMNPARSFAPALFEHRLDVLWIYFVGPFLGTALAALTYTWIRCEPVNENAKGYC